MMPTPELFADSGFTVPGEIPPTEGDGSLGILYATARVPAAGESGVPYLDSRDRVVRLGEAFVEIKDRDVDWNTLDSNGETAADIEKHKVILREVEEYGPMHSILEPGTGMTAAEARFISEVNSRLERTDTREVFLYIHGTATTFEEPTYTSAQLWRLFGYRGLPIAFSWASDRNLYKYVADVDTAEFSAALFRRLVELLLDESDAEKIHIIAFSAGTKLATHALLQLNLMNRAPGSPPLLGDLRFVAGDVERDLFGYFVAEGLLDIADSMTVYMSSSDQVLAASANIREAPRLGQTWTAGEFASDPLIASMADTDITFIDVTGVEGSGSGGGHLYLWNSPLIGSDLLVSAGYGLPPENRGLEYHEELGYWTFAPDYTDRLGSVLPGNQGK